MALTDRTFGYGRRRGERRNGHRPNRQQAHRETQRMVSYRSTGRRYLSGVDARLAARDVMQGGA